MTEEQMAVEAQRHAQDNDGEEPEESRHSDNDEGGDRGGGKGKSKGKDKEGIASAPTALEGGHVRYRHPLCHSD